MKSWKTTVGGIIAAVISILTFTGILTPEDAASVNEAAVGLIENVVAAIAAVVALIGFFSRDNDVSSEKAGAR